MIELGRYTRLKPEGFAVAVLVEGGMEVRFKRFDVENGKELPPEVSFLTFEEIEAKLKEYEAHVLVLRELAGLKPPSA